MSGYLDEVSKMVAGSRSRRSLLKGLAAGLAVAAVGRVGAGQASAAGSGQLILDYYDAIQKHAWSTAYNKLGGKFHQAQTLDQFTAGFADTAFTSVEIGQMSGPLSGNRYSYDVVVTAWLNDGTPQKFVGKYYDGREGGVTKIVDAKLSVADASSVPSLCTSSQLSTSVSGTSATGHRYSDITFTNTGDICVLAGMPSVLAKDAHGNKLVRGKREAGTTVDAVTLSSGDAALLQLDWVNWCGNSPANPVKLSISLPGSTGHFTLSNAIGVPPCLSSPGSSSSLSVRPWQ